MSAQKSILYPLVAVLVLILIPVIGVKLGLSYFFGVVVPYTAFIIFFGGILCKVVNWARSPVPFRIPTTCGQEKSFDWIKRNKFDNPFTNKEVFVRMLLEALCFRSLFRNLKMELRDGPKLAYGSAKWLWLGALAFHWSFLIILLRHMRFFAQPVPGFVDILQNVDGFFELGLPQLFLTDAVIVIALTYLFLRRVVVPQLRYISLPTDYFPLFLLFGLVLSGIGMRYFFKVDIIKVKELAMGLVTLKPTVPEGIGSLFYIHIFMVSVLFAYFPFSKLTHMAGIFLSPTRNLANNSRAKRHINPWNYPVKVHTYEEYEEEFREKMKEVGLPVEKE